VTDAEVLEELVALARAAGLRVRLVSGRPAAEGDPVPTSGACRVRGEPWIVLSASDALADRIGVVAEALRREAGDWLEGRWLAPALRERIAGGEPGA
jgi:hypothetical protein